MSITDLAPRPGQFARSSQRSRARRLGRSYVVLLMLAPAVVALALFRILPVIQAGIESVRDRDGSLSLETYQFMVESPQFLDMLRVTLVFNALINPVQVVLALALAVLLTQKLPATRLWRTIAFAPTAIPIAISAVVWGVAYRPADGPLNAVLEAIGLPAQPFLTSEAQVLPSIIVMASWVGVGYWMIFLIAGLQDIPSEYYEAATLDGAGWWTTFFQVTLPLLRRPLAFVLIATTVVNFLMFAPVQIMTGGGPNDASNLIMWSTFQQAYRFDDYALAAAQVVVLMAVLLVVVVTQFMLLRPKDTR